MVSELEQAWNWRESRGILTESPAVRVFHGPGEGSKELKDISIDRFAGGTGDHYWITEWGSVSTATKTLIAEFLKTRRAKSAVILSRPVKGVPNEPTKLMGEPTSDKFEVTENGARYWIQLLGARHPGLFLDHAPLRGWLTARAKGWKVLNTFAYTGSLSIACGMGGADHVTTLDLSKPTIAWAEANWKLNQLDAARGRFIGGDVFEWLPRLARDTKGANAKYDCVILDPPSFSHGNKGSFSTAKDLVKLHELAMDLLAPGGFLVTSINSANITRAKFEAEILAAAKSRKMSFEVMGEIQQPETFPNVLGDATERYLKGWILRKS